MILAIFILSIFGGAFGDHHNSSISDPTELGVPYTTYIYGIDVSHPEAIVVRWDALYPEKRPSSESECTCPAQQISSISAVYEIPAVGHTIYVDVDTGSPCVVPSSTCIKMGSSVSGRACGATTYEEDGKVFCAVESRTYGQNMFNIFERTHSSACYCAGLRTTYGMYSAPDYTTNGPSMSMVVGRVGPDSSYSTPILCAPSTGNVITRTSRVDGYVIITVVINPGHHTHGVCYGRYGDQMKQISQFSSSRRHDEIISSEIVSESAAEIPAAVKTVESSCSPVVIMLMLISVIVIIIALWSMSTRKIKLD